MKVRDLEIALVLAREMKAAAERSVDASLRLDQLQEVFGVQELDGAERARIQTALQMAGLEPFPSLLDADPSEPIRFGASKAAVTAGGAGAAPPPPPPPPGEEAAPDAQPAFPTVGEFARSKLRPRRFGVRRGDHGDDEAPPPPPPEPESVADTNGHVPDDPVVEEDVIEEEAFEEEHEPVADYEDEDELELEAESDLEPEPELQAEPELEAEPDLEPEPDQRAYVPLATPEPVAYEEPEPAAPPTARRAELVVALVPAVAIPVIVTSIAGWQFGLPFVALSVIAAGWVMSREKQGFLASLRNSAGARTALTITAVVTVLSAGAAVVLASLPSSSSSSKKSAAPAKQTQPPVASKPATPPKIQVHPKQKHRKHHKRATTPAPAGSPVDPATQGLVRVPPSGGTSTTPTP